MYMCIFQIIEYQQLSKQFLMLNSVNTKCIMRISIVVMFKCLGTEPRLSLATRTRCSDDEEHSPVDQARL